MGTRRCPTPLPLTVSLRAQRPPATVRSGVRRETTAQERLRTRHSTQISNRPGTLFPRRTAARCWRWTFPPCTRRSGLLLRHADVGRTSTFDDKVSVSVAVKDVLTATGTLSEVDRTDPDPDTPRMLLDFDAGEVEIHGLRLTFGGLDVDEEHGIYEVLAKDGRVVRAETVRSQRSLLEKFLGNGVRWLSRADEPESPVLYVDGLHEKFQITAGRMLLLSEKHISVDDAGTRDSETGDVDAARMKFRVADIALDTLYRRTSLSGPWVALGRDVGSPVHAPVYTFSLEDLRAGKIGIMAGDGTNAVTFTIQAVDQ